MALTGTGAWSQDSSESNTSQQNRDFFSGPVSVGNTSYDEAHTFEFGFSAVEVYIINTGAVDLVYQWLRRDGAVDNGVIPAGETRIWRTANKEGVRVRTDGGTSTCRIEAIG